MIRSSIFLAALTMMLAAFDGRSTAQSPGAPAPSSPAARVTGRAPDQPRFRSGVDLVSLDVCVRDSTGRFLSDLSPDDFLVLENGKLQRISFVMPSGAVPLTAILLIYRSASMYGPKLERAVEAADLFARLLGPDDQLEIIAFNHRAERMHAFGDNPARVPAALASIKATGGTSLNDALLVAANDFVRARHDALPETREVVVVLSDGEDTASLVGFEEVLPVLRRSGALVYTISLREGTEGEWLGATWPLLQLARDTGARALGVPHLDALPALYAEIDAEVRHLYRIGYIPNDDRRDGQWRTVSVRMRSRDANVRTRAGYYASRQRVAGAQP
jgi:Ca-activated chloride channel homolog